MKRKKQSNAAKVTPKSKNNTLDGTTSKHQSKTEKPTEKNVQRSPELVSLIERLIEVLKALPHKYPFWARLKIGKNRTTLVIDEAPAKNKKTKKYEDGFVHREATHTESKNTEKVEPNPDPTDPKPMHLKRPKTTPQKFFKPHNKKLNMPENLQKKYGPNSKGVKKK